MRAAGRRIANPPQVNNPPHKFRYLRNCMKDWRAIAKAHGLDLSARELDRIAPPLEALEAAFRPLVRELTPGMEPAVAFSADEDAL